MATHIGGQIEAVTEQRSLFGPDYGLLLLLGVISLAIHGWLLTHTGITARDSLGFSRYALNLENPAASAMPPDPSRTIVDVIKSEEHPPGFPAAVLAVSRIVRVATDLPTAQAMLLSAQLANVIAAVLLVIPTYLLGRMLFGRRVGFAAALLIQVLPVFAHVTSDGLSEGVYLLGATTAMMFGVRAVRRPGVGWFLLTGLSVGATYLVRPEGLFVAASVGLMIVILGAMRKWPRDAALARLTALAVGIGMVAGPYVMVIGRMTNKTTPLQMIAPSEGPKGLIWKGQPTSQNRTSPSTSLLATWWNESEDSGSSRLLWAIKAVVTETLKTGFYVPAILGFAGLIAFRRRAMSDPGLAVMALLAGLNAAVLVAMAMSKGYVSERHTVLISLILCLFAAAVADPLFGQLSRLPVVGRFWAGRYAAPGLMLAIVASALPSTLKPLHQHRVGHKHAGEFLATKIQPGDTVIDPFSWAEWFAGRTLHVIPADPAAQPGSSRWVVLEHITHDNPHARLPRLQAALQVAGDRANPPKVAYQWPENVPFAEAKVIVYQQVVKP